MKKLDVAALVLVASLAASGAAQGASADGTEGHHEHDGLFLRFLVGPGHTSLKSHAGVARSKVSGGGGALAIAVGGAVVRNLVLFGEILTSTALDPRFERGETVMNVGADSSAGLTGLGAGLAYYLPSNVYLSGTLAFSQVIVEGDRLERHQSEFGPGMSVTLGKEWWVSKNWGLGIAGQLFMAEVKDRPALPGFSATTWRASSVNALFTASFN